MVYGRTVVFANGSQEGVSDGASLVVCDGAVERVVSSSMTEISLPHQAIVYLQLFTQHIHAGAAGNQQEQLKHTSNFQDKTSLML